MILITDTDPILLVAIALGEYFLGLPFLIQIEVRLVAIIVEVRDWLAGVAEDGISSLSFIVPDGHRTLTP